MVLVLYRIESVRNGEWWCEETFNAFDADVRVEDSKAIIFGDLLQFIGNNVLLKKVFDKYSIFCELVGKLIPLTNPAHILPVSTTNTLKLRLRPSAITMHSSVPPLLVSTMMLSNQNVNYLLGKGNFSFSERRRPSYSSQQSSPAGFDVDQRDNREKLTRASSTSASTANGVNLNNSSLSGLNSYVGEDAAAAISDAAEVAKDAAKTLFGFAATWSKSVLDAASTVSTSTLVGSAPGRLSGSVTLGKIKVQIIRELAEGGFGIVYIAQEGSKSYALKQLICQSKVQLDDARTEIENLLLLRGHPNIIELIDHGSATPPNQPRQFYLLFPLYPIGTAWEAIERASLGIDPNSRLGPPWPFPEQRAVRVTLCAARALEFMHRKGLSHRDMKPQNILLSEISEEKHVLMDFGSVGPAKISIDSRSDALLVEDEASQKTSMAYRPPELTSVPFPPCTLDERIDVWSLGCTMFCLAFGRSPFETTKEGVQKLAILNGRWQAPSDLRMRDCVFSRQYMAVIEDMLQVDWTARPFMPDVIRKLQQLL